MNDNKKNVSELETILNYLENDHPYSKISEFEDDELKKFGIEYAVHITKDLSDAGLMRAYNRIEKKDGEIPLKISFIKAAETANRHTNGKYGDGLERIVFARKSEGSSIPYAKIKDKQSKERRYSNYSVEIFKIDDEEKKVINIDCLTGGKIVLDKEGELKKFNRPKNYKELKNHEKIMSKQYDVKEGLVHRSYNKIKEIIGDHIW